MFLPVTADETASGNPMPDADLLSGVSLTFPDGTIVNIKRGSAKALVSFLSLYWKGGEPYLGWPKEWVITYAKGARTGDWNTQQQQ